MMSSVSVKLSYITTCKGRLAHLQQSLPRVVDQPGIECVVVDYDCPEKSADWVASNFPEVRVVRVTNEPTFNASRARNLGAQHSSAPWLGFFDADILLDTGFSARVLPKLVRGHFYRAHPLTYQTWGSLICERCDFLRIGGYDEAYSGWGGEDDDLIAMFLKSGLRRYGFPASLLNELAHDEELRMRYSPIQNRWMQSRINQLYLQVKLDLYRMYGQAFNRKDACALYTEIQQTVMNSESSGRTDYYFDVPLPPFTFGSPPQEDSIQVTKLQRTMRYSVGIGGRFRDPGIPRINIPCI